jgi:hypothetical protein
MSTSRGLGRELLRVHEGMRESGGRKGQFLLEREDP